MIPRRGLLAGLGALLAAPAIIRTPGLLMPVRPVVEVEFTDALRDRLVAAWSLDMARGMSEAIAEMNRQRLAHVRFLAGANWSDDDVAQMHGGSEHTRNAVTDRAQRGMDFGTSLMGPKSFMDAREHPKHARYQAAPRPVLSEMLE